MRDKTERVCERGSFIAITGALKEKGLVMPKS